MRWPQFTIGRLMAAVAAVAGFLALWQVGTFSAILVLAFLTLVAVGWLPTRGRPRLAARLFGVATAWASVSLGLTYVFLPYLRGLLVFGLFLASVPTIPVAAGFGLSWVATRPRWPSRLRAGMLVALAVALPFSMILTRWPFRMAFQASSPGLERLADRVEAGEELGQPEWAGIYRVIGTKRLPGSGDLALIISSDWTGDSSLVRRAVPLPPGSPYEFDNLEVRAGVKGQWYIFDED